MSFTIPVLLVSGGTGVYLSPAITVNGGAADPLDSTATIRLQSTGDMQRNVDGVYLDLGKNWYFPQPIIGIGSSYECRFVYVSGNAINVGTAGSWLTINANREFGYSQTTIGVKSGVHTLEIGYVGTSTAIWSCTVNLYAEVTV